MARVSATRFRCMYTESGRLCKPSRVHLPNVRCRKHLLVLPLRNHPAQEDRPDIRPCLGSGCTRSPSHTSCTPEAPCTPSPSSITARTRSDMKPPRSETCCCPAPSCPPQTSRPSSSSSARPEAHTPRPSTSPQSDSSRSSPSQSRSHLSPHGRTHRRICTLPHCSPQPAPPSVVDQSGHPRQSASSTAPASTRYVLTGHAKHASTPSRTFKYPGLHTLQSRHDPKVHSSPLPHALHSRTNPSNSPSAPTDITSYPVGQLMSR